MEKKAKKRKVKVLGGKKKLKCCKKKKRITVTKGSDNGGMTYPLQKKKKKLSTSIECGSLGWGGEGGESSFALILWGFNAFTLSKRLRQCFFF